MGEIAQKKNTDLAALDAKLAARAKVMQESITIAGNNIMLLKSGEFKMPGGETREELEMVILDYRYRNQFYPRAWKAGEFSPAECFAVGDEQAQLEPSPEAPKPQNADCATCPKAQFDSHPNGRGGKACQEQFLMAVMFADLGESEEVFLLKASPTAAAAASGYVTKMVEQSGHPIKVVTKFTVNTANDYPKLAVAFSAPNALYAQHAEHLSNAERLLTSVPKKGGSDKKDTAVDTGAARSSRKRG